MLKARLMMFSWLLSSCRNMISRNVRCIAAQLSSHSSGSS